MKNIVLIGMPGAGKSTVGVLLAKALCMDFCDTDLILQQLIGRSLCSYIAERGSEEFISFENKTVACLELRDTVIATGGSIVYGNEAMRALSESGDIVYLYAPLDVLKSRIGNITTRGVAITHGKTLDDIFIERAPLYEKYADITVDCGDSSPEESVKKIIVKIDELKSLNKQNGDML